MMKKLLAVVAGMLCAAALVVNAQDAAAPAKKQLTADQQALMKQMLDKYDANKDGKLDKSERAKMTQEDKDKMIKAGLMKTPKKKSTDATTATPSTPAAPASGN